MVLGVLLSALSVHDAAAGGFDIPDNGAQALGRGAAFVAKADDGTAIYYNPAGLARQRGTRLYGGGNLYLHSFEFQRAGSYPDDPNNTATPWGDQPYPSVSNAGGAYVSPFLAASTDFGSLDRFTIAAGVFSPPDVGNRTFPIAVRGAPSASRYDFVQSAGSMLFPTLAAAFRVTPWLDVGLSGHLVVAKFAETQIVYADPGADSCLNVEYQPCDSRATLDATATSFATTLGVLARPTPSIGIGLTVRTPVTLNASGTYTATTPRAGSANLTPGDATYVTHLPLIVRGGLRYVSLDRDYEVYDLELDGTFEAWTGAQGDGPQLTVGSLGTYKDIDTLIVHGYNNTVSFRGGGAYNFEAAGGTLSFRAGAYFDSSATTFAYTRLDIDTLAKIAGTLGLGYRRGGFGIDLGYAAAASIPRVVGTDQGDVRPIDLAKGGRPLDDTGKKLPAVNEGAYRGFTHILSVGISLTFDELFGAGRTFTYGNPYEKGYVGEGAFKDTAPKEPEGKPRKPVEEEPIHPEVPLQNEPKPEVVPIPDAPASKKPPPPPSGKIPPRHEWWEDADE